MYKGFAIAVLLIAPILVLAADEFAPKPGTKNSAPTAAAAPAKPKAKPPVQQNFAAITPAPTQDMTAMAGMPMSDAGKPMLDTSQTGQFSAVQSDAAPSYAPESPRIAQDRLLTDQWKSEAR